MYLYGQREKQRLNVLMKKVESYPVRCEVLLYSAKELKAQFGIEKAVLDLLERNGLVRPVPGQDGALHRYSIYDVKLGLAVLAQSIPLEEVSEAEIKRGHDMSTAEGWKAIIRRAVIRNRNMPSQALAAAIYDAVVVAAGEVALSQVKIIVPGIGQLLRVSQKERVCDTMLTKRPMLIPAHEVWKLRVSARLKKAVRQRTTKKTQSKE